MTPRVASFASWLGRWSPLPENIAGKATVPLRGLRFLDPEPTNKFMELTGNLPRKDSYPLGRKDLGWFAVLDECLNEQWFETLHQVRTATAAWRQDYNQVRPHSSLGRIPPARFAELHRQRAGDAAQSTSTITQID